MFSVILCIVSVVVGLAVGSILTACLYHDEMRAVQRELDAVQHDLDQTVQALTHVLSVPADYEATRVQCLSEGVL